MEKHGTWIGTNLRVSCPCGATVALQQRLGHDPAQVRMPLHGCPGYDYKPISLVLDADLQRLATEDVVASDERVSEWWRGRREGAQRLGQYAARLLKLVLALAVVLVPRLALASEGYTVSVLGLELLTLACVLAVLAVGAVLGVWGWCRTQGEVVVMRSQDGRGWVAYKVSCYGDGGRVRHHWWRVLADARRLSRGLPVAGLLLVLGLAGCDDGSAAVHRGLDWLLLVGCGVFGGLWAAGRDRVHDLEQVRDVLQGEVVFARREAQTAHLRADAAESVLQVMAGKAGGVQ